MVEEGASQGFLETSFQSGGIIDTWPFFMTVSLFCGDIYYILLLKHTYSGPGYAFSSITEAIVTATDVPKTLVLRYFKKCHSK